MFFFMISIYELEKTFFEFMIFLMIFYDVLNDNFICVFFLCLVLCFLNACFMIIFPPTSP
jgi:hypothetical protein